LREQHLSPLGATKGFAFVALLATPRLVRPHTRRAADEATAVLNSCHSTSLRYAFHNFSKQDETLFAKISLASLSTRASHFI